MSRWLWQSLVQGSSGIFLDCFGSVVRVEGMVSGQVRVVRGFVGEMVGLRVERQP